MHHAGGQGQGLAGLEGETVQQQSREDTGVGGEVLVDFHGRAGEDTELTGGVEMVHGGAQHLVDEVAAVVEAEHVQEDLLEGRGAGAVTQGTDHGGQGVSDLQGLEQLSREQRVAETHEGLERGQGDDGLGLGPVVLEGTFGGAQGNPHQRFAGVAIAGLLPGGMGLEAKGGCGRQDLHQERQPASESHHGGPAEPVGILCQILRQG